MATGDEHHLRPALPREVLGKRVGEHRAARRHVQEVRPALPVAELVVAGAHVEQQRLRRGVGRGEQVVALEIGDEQPAAFGDERRDALADILPLADRHVLQAVLVAEESPGRRVVAEPELGTAETLVLDPLVDQRQRQRWLDLARETHDVDDERIVRRARGGHRERTGERRRPQHAGEPLARHTARAPARPGGHARSSLSGHGHPPSGW